MESLINKLKDNVSKLPINIEDKNNIVDDIVQFSNSFYTTYITSTSLECFNEDNKLYSFKINNDEIEWEKSVTSKMIKGEKIKITLKGTTYEKYLKRDNDYLIKIKTISYLDRIIYKQENYYNHNEKKETYYLDSEDNLEIKKIEKEENIFYIIKDYKGREREINKDEFYNFLSKIENIKPSLQSLKLYINTSVKLNYLSNKLLYFIELLEHFSLPSYLEEEISTDIYNSFGNKIIINCDYCCNKVEYFSQNQNYDFNSFNYKASRNKDGLWSLATQKNEKTKNQLVYKTYYIFKKNNNLSISKNINIENLKELNPYKNEQFYSLDQEFINNKISHTKIYNKERVGFERGKYIRPIRQEITIDNIKDNYYIIRYTDLLSNTTKFYHIPTFANDKHIYAEEIKEDNYLKLLEK